MEDGRDLGVGYLKEPIVIRDSYVELTDKPGLGIEVDEEFVRAHTFEGNWDTPRLFHVDGSVAQW